VAARARPGRYTRDDAARVCDGLATPGGPWRLPTVLELISVVDDTRSNPSIDPLAFPHARHHFWTSTPRAGTPTMGWNVYFGLGDAYYYDLTTRTPSAASRSRHRSTMVVVSRGRNDHRRRHHADLAGAVDDTARTWDDAVAYCAS